MSAVGGQVGPGRKTPIAATHSGIAEEGAAGIDAECVSRAKVAVEGACKGGCAVVGAGTIDNPAAFDADVVANEIDAAACCRCSGIDR